MFGIAAITAGLDSEGIDAAANVAAAAAAGRRTGRVCLRSGTAGRD